VSQSWPDFVAEIERLCSKRSESVSYKVLFLGRHGEGFHNVAIAKYGQKAWEEYVFLSLMPPFGLFEAKAKGNGPY